MCFSSREPLVRISSAKIVKETNLSTLFIIINVRARDFFRHLPTKGNAYLTICYLQLSDLLQKEYQNALSALQEDLPYQPQKDRIS